MTPIETAVLPLKQRAIDAAEARANQIIDSVCTDLNNNGWDIDKTAPYPRSVAMSRIECAQKQAKYSLYRSLVSDAPLPEGRFYRSHSEPHIVQLDLDKTARFIKEMQEMAAQQFDAFSYKLNTKVGDHTDAKLDGTSCWDYSYVLVTKADGSTETWKTQCISKYSKLGKFFHQWPTRKLVKGSKR